MPAKAVIEARNVRKTYGRTVAVHDVSFEVYEGEIFGLIGPNGAGKTTTMECVEGIRKVDRGTVSVLSLDPRKDVYELQNRIGVQLQQAQLQKRIKVWEAVDLWASLYPRSVDAASGILKRLRATPLRPQTILVTHVVVKLLLTALTLILLVLAGKSFYKTEGEVHLVSFAFAMLLAMVSILSIGFVIASIVPTARFAQPVGSVVLYPMLVFSGLFFPLDLLPPVVERIAYFLPLTHAVSLLQGIWTGGSWSGHLVEVAALVANLVVCTVVSGKIFRWE